MRDDASIALMKSTIVRSSREAGVPTDALGHRRILRDPAVVAAAVSFLAAHARVPGRRRVALEAAAAGSGVAD